MGRGALERMLTYHLRIVGRVQGVGFRESLRREAARLGVTGWVRNRANGSVEAVVEAPAGAVGALLARAGDGPPAARGDRLQANPARHPPAVRCRHGGGI